MANFCSNCGKKIKPESKFCGSCGLPIEIEKTVIGYWQAKEYDTHDDYSRKIKGSLALTKKEIVFFRYAAFSGKAKKWRTIPISSIKSIARTPIFNLVMIRYNKAPKGSGALRRFFSNRTMSYKISDWQSFVENIRKLNPNIKIKC